MSGSAPTRGGAELSADDASARGHAPADGDEASAANSHAAPAGFVGLRPRSVAWTWGAAASIGLAAASLLLLRPLPIDVRVPWINATLDFGHVPLFLLLTVLIAGVLHGRTLWAAGIGVLLAALAECAQAFTGRSATVSDLISGGIGCSLVWVADRAGQATGYRRLGWVVTATVLLAWPLRDLLPPVVGAASCWHRFPTITDFRRRWEVSQWIVYHGQLTRWRDEQSGDMVGRLVTEPNESGGLILFPVMRDWSRYHDAVCEFTVVDEPVTMSFSIRDGRHVEPPEHRFDQTATFPPGEHRVRFDLESLARGDEFAPLLIQRVKSFHLDVRHAVESQTVLVRRLQLE